MKNNIVVRCGQALLALGTLAISLNAHAAGVSTGICTVNNVFRDLNGVRISCAETNASYYGQTTCVSTNFTSDTLRSWESMAEASLLAGKHLSILYDNGGSNCIYTVQVFN